MSTHRIITGDCIEGMKTLPDGCVHTCITSPPYFGLRDYGHGAQIGLEKTPEEYVTRMVEVFREVRRVLRDDGTLWLNLGDSYWGGKGQNGTSKALGNAKERGYQQPRGTIVSKMRPQDGKHYTLKPKDIIGIPWRIAFALQADGWWLRQDIIWNKPNPMPESVADRCTKAHEYIFMLSKKPHYYYDHEAVKESACNWGTRDRSNMRDGTTDPKLKHHGLKGKEWEDNPMKNKRSVWTVNTRGYKGAHFAVYPEDLILPCVLSGTSAHGCCLKCGKPWQRVVEKGQSTYSKIKQQTGHDWRDMQAQAESNGTALKAGGNKSVGGTRLPNGTVPSLNSANSHTVGWQAACKCGGNLVPCTVLDPFTGSGTTAVVAMKNGRDFIGCELNPEYIKIAENRIKAEVPVTLDTLLEEHA